MKKIMTGALVLGAAFLFAQPQLAAAQEFKAHGVYEMQPLETLEEAQLKAEKAAVVDAAELACGKFYTDDEIEKRKLTRSRIIAVAAQGARLIGQTRFKTVYDPTAETNIIQAWLTIDLDRETVERALQSLLKAKEEVKVDPEVAKEARQEFTLLNEALGPQELLAGFNSQAEKLGMGLKNLKEAETDAKLRQLFRTDMNGKWRGGIYTTPLGQADTVVMEFTKPVTTEEYIMAAGCWMDAIYGGQKPEKVEKQQCVEALMQATQAKEGSFYSTCMKRKYIFTVVVRKDQSGFITIMAVQQ